MQKHKLSTDLGEMELTIYPDVTFEVYGEMVASINRVDYSIHVYATLDLRFEDWRIRMDLRRAVDRSKNFTQNAYSKAYENVIPKVREWLDNHPNELFAGHSTAIMSQVERANHKLDNIMEQVSERREMLEKMKVLLESGGRPSDKEIELLNQLWGNEWRFS